jgi:glycosyltransferase involved in cell wall biosynthesis
MTHSLRRIAHLTSVHPRYDTRIFLKMCSSLAAHGYKVSLVVADGLGDEIKNGVTIVDVGAKTGGRLSRMTKTVRRVFATAKALDVDIYHLHDPELITIGLKLKRLGKTVIFDSHEDAPRQILGKPYLNAPLRHLIGQTFGLYESFACKQLDAVIAATPFIRDKFLTINPNGIDINNFPMLGELQMSMGWGDKSKQICYVGGIAKVRGIREVVRAMEHVSSGARLQLGGKFSETKVEHEVKGYSGWQAVDELGFLDRGGVRTALNRSVAGLVTLHPIINYLDALPVKMFEYMSAGIPVIASHFPLWRDIIEGNDCGLCVDPMNPQAIAEAIDFLVNNPKRARQMGENGYKAVQEKYNWGIEEQKLFSIYASLIKTKQ